MEQNDMMLKLFRTAYCVAKHSFFLSSFSTLVNLQECNGLRISHAYKNRKAAIHQLLLFIKKACWKNLMKQTSSLCYLTVPQMSLHVSNRLSVLKS